MSVIRTCTRCGAEKEASLDFFPPHKAGKYGLHSRCIPCKKAEDAERRARPDQKARQKSWRDANKDRIREYALAYRASGYKSTAHVKAWRDANIEHARKTEASRKRSRRERDPAFLLRGRLSARLNSLLKGKNGRTSDQVLGYSRDELVSHIERQFERGMSWDLVAKGEIEIDHIVPISAFKIDSFDHPDFRVCWGLPNLRPMWKSENRSKGAKRLTLL